MRAERPCARIKQIRRRGGSIRVRRLRLTNFRNYARLDLRIDQGITLVDGPNGHGKTNLLEAIYLMAIGRSARSAADRQMVRAEAFEDFLVHAQAAGEVIGMSGRVSLQVDLSGGSRDSKPLSAARSYRIIGFRRHSESTERPRDPPILSDF